MADLIRFVDSIAASPTVRLDLNDEVSFFVRGFSAPPPRLRRSIAANSMRDGIHVGSATHDARTLTIDLDVRDSTQDDAALKLQKLWRELDRETNVLMYQPSGATKPVFFRTFRSDASSLEDVMAQAAMRVVTLEILAAPHAVGLKETLGPYTMGAVTTATNPGYVDLPVIKGDVAADLVLWDNSPQNYGLQIIATHAGGNAHTMTATLECEAMTPGTDTTNPGGAADVAMSGTGSTNYLRTSFATATMTGRLSTSLTMPGGRYRVLAVVRRTTGSSSVIKVAAAAAPSGGIVTWGTTTDVALSTLRCVVDLGVIGWPTAPRVGNSTVTGMATATLHLGASRTGGTDTLDWDCVWLVPAGGQADEVHTTTMLAKYDADIFPTLVLDGEHGSGFCTSSAGDPTTTNVVPAAVWGLSGDFPKVAPNTSNRLYVLAWDEAFAAPGIMLTNATVTVSAAYWPRYLFVRPVSS